MGITTITLNMEVKRKLEKLKRYDRESFNELLSRLLFSKLAQKSNNSIDLAETVEILSNPEIMRSLAKSLDDLKKGKTYSIDEV